MRFPFENRCSRALSCQMVHLINDFKEGMAIADKIVAAHLPWKLSSFNEEKHHTSDRSASGIPLELLLEPGATAFVVYSANHLFLVKSHSSYHPGQLVHGGSASVTLVPLGPQEKHLPKPQNFIFSRLAETGSAPMGCRP